MERPMISARPSRRVKPVSQSTALSCGRPSTCQAEAAATIAAGIEPIATQVILGTSLASRYAASTTKSPPLAAIVGKGERTMLPSRLSAQAATDTAA